MNTMNTMNIRPSFLLACVALAAMGAPTTARAATDYKFIAPADCVAYAPDTTAAELQLSTVGLYNPGTTVERILCPMPRDQDDSYLAGDVDVVGYYRGLGATPGKMACTLLVGSTSMQSTAVYTASGVGPTVANGARASVVMHGAGQSQDFWVVPVSVLCTIEPKVSFAGLFFNESGPTHIP